MAQLEKKMIVKSIALSLGILLATSLQGCGGSQDADQQTANADSGMETLQGDLQQQNYFLVIEQTAVNPDKYVLAERHETSGDTRAVLKKMDGSEVILSNDELKALAEAEAKKVEAGTSALTQEPTAEASSGMGLGEMVLASAAGALIGGMLANKLSGNSNFKRNQQASTRPAAAISQKAKARPKPPSRQQPAKPRSSTRATPRKGFSFGKKRRRR